MDLKSVLDLYDQGKADLMDIALMLTEECGLSDPMQVKRADVIITTYCKINKDLTALQG